MDFLIANYLAPGWMIVMWAGIGLMLVLRLVQLEIWNATIVRKARKILKRFEEE